MKRKEPKFMREIHRIRKDLSKLKDDELLKRLKNHE